MTELNIYLIDYKSPATTSQLVVAESLESAIKLVADRCHNITNVWQVFLKEPLTPGVIPFHTMYMTDMGEMRCLWCNPSMVELFVNQHRMVPI